MDAIKLYKLDMSASGCGDTRVTADGVSVCIEYEFASGGEDLIGGVAFSSVVAYRFRKELYSRGFVQEASDAVAEIVDSKWCEDLRAIAPAGVSDAAKCRHFAVFLASNGYFEIMAEDFAPLPIRQGLLGR
jgi:hypothetical protein